MYEEMADRFTDCAFILKKAVQALASPGTNVIGLFEDKEKNLED